MFTIGTYIGKLLEGYIDLRKILLDFRKIKCKMYSLCWLYSMCLSFHYRN